MVSSSKPAAPFVFGDIQKTRHTYSGLPHPLRPQFSSKADRRASDELI